MLDINKLIEKTQALVHDGKIIGAEKGTVPVQEIEIAGKTYELSVTLTLKTDKS